MEYEDITHKIIGCAYQVFNQLGFGFLEKIYKKALVMELEKIGLKVEEEKPLIVYYDDQEIGEFYIDLYVEDNIVIELKSVCAIAKEHEVQLVNYLKGLRKNIGLLINFSTSGVKVKRKYREFRQD